MRLNRGVRTIAAVATLAAATAPTAHAVPISAGGGGGLPATGSPVADVAPGPRDSGSTDWALIAIGAGGATVLIGAGVGGSRAYSRRRTSTRRIKVSGAS